MSEPSPKYFWISSAKVVQRDDNVGDARPLQMLDDVLRDGFVQYGHKGLGAIQCQGPEPRSFAPRHHNSFHGSKNPFAFKPAFHCRDFHALVQTLGPGRSRTVYSHLLMVVPGTMVSFTACTVFSLLLDAKKNGDRIVRVAVLFYVCVLNATGLRIISRTV